MWFDGYSLSPAQKALAADMMSSSEAKWVTASPFSCLKRAESLRGEVSRVAAELVNIHLRTCFMFLITIYFFYLAFTDLIAFLLLLYLFILSDI